MTTRTAEDTGEHTLARALPCTAIGPETPHKPRLTSLCVSRCSYETGAFGHLCPSRMLHPCSLTTTLVQNLECCAASHTVCPRCAMLALDVRGRGTRLHWAGLMAAGCSPPPSARIGRVLSRCRCTPLERVQVSAVHIYKIRQDTALATTTAIFSVSALPPDLI